MATTTGSGVAIWNITIKQNSDWSPTITWLDDNGAPVNLTGYSMKLEIKAFAASPISLITLSSSGSSGSRIVLGGTAGTIQLIFAHADTASLSPIGLPIPGSPILGGVQTFALGVYDLQYTDPTGNQEYLVQGTVSLNQAVTV